MTEKISGIVSAYSTFYNGKTYLFFGDQHTGLENVCDIPCENSFEFGNIIHPSGSEKCSDFSVYLYRLFESIQNKGEYADFFIEMPYIRCGEFKPSKEDLDPKIKKQGYLFKIRSVFDECFEKRCRFKNIRFHQSDPRMAYIEDDTDSENTFYCTSKTRVRIVDYFFVLLEVYLYKFNKQGKLAVFSDNLNYQLRKLDDIIRDLYNPTFDFPTSRHYEIFKLYLTSDNIKKDLENVLANTDMYKYPDIIETIMNPRLFVTRDGKMMHKIRAQLYGLEKDGRKDIAENIVLYLLETYRSFHFEGEVINIWKTFTIIFDGYKKKKYKEFAISPLLGRIKEKLDEIFSHGEVSTESLLMDAYILSRMFRIYSNDKSHIDSSVVIVFCGAAHIALYVDFFEKVLGASFDKYFSAALTQENGRRCVDLKTRNILDVQFKKM